MSYLIKKDNKTNSITYMEYNLEGYKFTPKSKKNAKIKINQLMIVNPTMIDKILTIKFNDMFKKLMSYATTFLYNQDDDSSTGAYLLGEIEKLKSIINNKYRNYIASEKQRFFLEKLNYLENLLKTKMLAQMSFTSMYVPEEEIIQGKGR